MLIRQIFGRTSDYSYQLQLKEELPQLVYKERNFNMELKLVDSEGQPILNSKNGC